VGGVPEENFAIFSFTARQLIVSRRWISEKSLGSLSRPSGGLVRVRRYPQLLREIAGESNRPTASGRCRFFFAYLQAAERADPLRDCQCRTAQLNEKSKAFHGQARFWRECSRGGQNKFSSSETSSNREPVVLRRQRSWCDLVGVHKPSLPAAKTF